MKEKIKEVQTTIRLKEDLHRRLKVLVAMEGRTIYSTVVRLIEDYVKKGESHK